MQISTKQMAETLRIRRSFSALLQYLVMVVLICVMLFPFFWLVASSLKAPQELGALPPIWWPARPQLTSYLKVFEVMPFMRALLNSIIVTVSSTVGILITSIMAGYVFAKHEFRAKNIIFICVLMTMMIPQFVILVPLYRMMDTLNLTNSYPGLILPNLANGFGIFLMRQFISGIPDDLLEAARMDGASEWKILWSVIVPLLRPAVAALTLFAFVFQWNNFLWPLSIVSSQEMSTVVLTLNGLRTYTSSITFANIVMAGTVIGILPGVVLTLWVQKYFIEGISMTGIKG